MKTNIVAVLIVFGIVGVPVILWLAGATLGVVALWNGDPAGMGKGLALYISGGVWLVLAAIVTKVVLVIADRH